MLPYIGRRIRSRRLPTTGEILNTLFAASLTVACAALIFQSVTRNDAQLSRLSGQVTVWSWAFAALGLAIRVFSKAVRRAEPSADDLDRQVADLIGTVLTAEVHRQALLLGAGANELCSARIDLAFSQVLASACRRDPGVRSAGRLLEVGNYYRSTESGRLVILGEAGSGKTMLALELLIQLLRDPLDAGGMKVMPVLFSLPTWRAGEQPLLAWLTSQVAERYKMRYTRAAALVQTGRILPVLDGLDEMDLHESEPVRATAAIRELNRYRDPQAQKLARVVVVSRQSLYQRIADRDDVPGGLHEATCICIQPLTPAQIKEYLNAHLNALNSEAENQAWKPFLDKLSRRRGPVTEELKTPWRLALALVYSRGGKPSDLLDLVGHRGARGRLDRLLLGQFVLKATQGHSDAARNAHGRSPRYSTGQVQAWLGLLARHLAERRASGQSGSDIDLHELWSLAGRTRVRLVHAALAALPLLLLGASLIRRVGLITFLVFTFAALSFGLTAARTQLRPNQFDPRALTTTPGRSALTAGLAGGIIFGLTGGFALGVTFGLKFGLSNGLIAGPAAGLAAGLAAGFRAGSTAHAVLPAEPLFDDLMFGLAGALFFGVALGFATGLIGGLRTGLAGGLAAGLAAGLSASLEVNPRSGPAFGCAAGLTTGLVLKLAGGHGYGLINALVFGAAVGLAAGIGTGLKNKHAGLTTGLAAALTAPLVVHGAVGPTGQLATGIAFGLVVGLTGGLAFWMAAWTRFCIAIVILGTQRRLPFRLGTFLNWAYNAGLLRISGTSYQFRHNELRDWLQGSTQVPRI
jgi:hypothetical protein